MKIIKTDLRNKIRDVWMNNNIVAYIDRKNFKTIDYKSHTTIFLENINLLDSIVLNFNIIYF